MAYTNGFTISCFPIPLFIYTQEEELDERKVQVRPPGFHVIFIPFADDFRKVKFEQTTKGIFVSFASPLCVSFKS